MFAGLLFLTTLSECQKYFPEYALLINSFIFVGTGLGAVLLGTLNTRCVNPKLYLAGGSGFYVGELDFIAYRFPKCILHMGWTIAGLGIVGCALIWGVCKYNDAN